MGQFVQVQPALQPGDVGGTHLRRLRPSRKPANENVHQHHVHCKQRHQRLPELFAKLEAGYRIKYREHSGEQDTQHIAQHRRAPHLRNVAGEPDDAKDEEDSQKECDE